MTVEELTGQKRLGKLIEELEEMKKELDEAVSRDLANAVRRAFESSAGFFGSTISRDDDTMEHFVKIMEKLKVSGKRPSGKAVELFAKDLEAAVTKALKGASMTYLVDAAVKELSSRAWGQFFRRSSWRKKQGVIRKPIGR